mgnify:CR=1 FL=1
MHKGELFHFNKAIIKMVISTMQRYSEVVGLPVICIDDGRRIGVVRDAVFCPVTREVRALILERKGYEIDHKVVLYEDILNLGRDAVVVNGVSCAVPMRKLEAGGRLKGRMKINGLRIYSKSGKDLGTVKDILFDGSTGKIEGVEVSDGLVQDLVDGRNILPLFGKVEFSDEIILVDREAVEEMVSTGGGIRRKIFGEK